MIVLIVKIQRWLKARRLEDWMANKSRNIFAKWKDLQTQVARIKQITEKVLDQNPALAFGVSLSGKLLLLWLQQHPGLVPFIVMESACKYTMIVCCFIGFCSDSCTHCFWPCIQDRQYRTFAKQLFPDLSPVSPLANLYSHIEYFYLVISSLDSLLMLSLDPCNSCIEPTCHYVVEDVVFAWFCLIIWRVCTGKKNNGKCD